MKDDFNLILDLLDYKNEKTSKPTQKTQIQSSKPRLIHKIMIFKKIFLILNMTLKTCIWCPSIKVEITWHLLQSQNLDLKKQKLKPKKEWNSSTTFTLRTQPRKSSSQKYNSHKCFCMRWASILWKRKNKKLLNLLLTNCSINWNNCQSELPQYRKL